MISLIVPVALVVLVVFAIRAATRRAGHGGTEPYGVRRFFIYLMLYGLVVVSTVGVAGLLGQLLSRSDLLAAAPVESARNITFVAVGVPLTVALVVWLRRTFLRDTQEADSIAWASYVTAASLTALVVTMFAAHDALSWALGIAPRDGHALGRLVVWGALWGVHWTLDRRLTPARRAQPHLLIGSLIALATAAVGLAGLVAASLDVLLGLPDQAIAVGTDPIRAGAVTLVVGAPVWLLYWARTAIQWPRTGLWHAYVLLAGLSSGAVAALVGTGLTLFDVLVWLLGDPASTQASGHFRDVSGSLAAAGIGVLVWWYHRSVLGESATSPRTEVRRAYEYLMAAIGVVATAAGLTALLVGLIETLTRSTALAGSSAVNTLLAAVTILFLGGPMWLLSWRRTQAAVRTAPEEEQRSSSRRIFVVVLSGLGVLTALAALLTGVFILFEDALSGGVGLETLRRMRYPIGLLVAALIVAAYHGLVYLRERPTIAAAEHHPRFVLLVGPRDPELEKVVAHDVGARVSSWRRMDHDDPPWSASEVTQLLRTSDADEVLVLADGEGLHAIPVDRK